jgi:hypothetical protein
VSSISVKIITMMSFFCKKRILVKCVRGARGKHCMWPGKSIWSYGSSHSRGVAILFNSNFSFELSSFHHDNEGRLLVADILVNKVK